MNSATARILVVEDEAIVGMDLEQGLTALGHEVVAVVSTGEEAVRLATTLRPHLVLMDIRLGGRIDGIQAAVEIGKQTGIPVVFLTAHADASTLDRAAEAQPFGYLVKPFDEAELQATIRTALQKHGVVRDLDRLVDERSAELVRTEVRFRHTALLAELGNFALRTPDLSSVLDRAVVAVCGVLGAPHGGVARRQPDGSYAWASGLGWPERSLGRAVVVDPGPEVRGPATDPALTGMTAVIPSSRPDDSPWGLLAVHAPGPRPPIDGELVWAVASVIASAVHRLELEAELSATQHAATRHRLRTEHAELALRERDDFIAVAAHELRTPLNVLSLSVGAMAHAPDLNPSARDRDRMTRQVRRLATLVELLLDVSRMSEGRLQLQPEPLELGALVAEVVDDLAADAARAHSPVSLAVGDPLRGRFDAARMRQVVGNLLSNAIKYGAGTPISVVVGEVAGAGRIEVCDGGPGIAEADLPRIFDRFVRAAPIDSYGGLGLGLYVAKCVVEAHGGSLAVWSEVGRGTRFTVTVPLHPGGAT